jgi:NADPH-dependent 2,4-dienoyl-CoA reductase/sulfur reductase-like enzyme
MKVKKGKIMIDTTYLIIGGGMTAAAAVKGIREVDAIASITILSEEKHNPYQRPPLTKKLWQGKPESTVWIDLPQSHLETDLGHCVTAIDPSRRLVHSRDGEDFRYSRLLLATGGTPRRLPFGGTDILYYRTLDDFRRLKDWTGKGARFGVIGGGFIGSELAAALASTGEQAIMVFPESGIGARIYPADLSAFVTDYYRQKGVEMFTGAQLEDVNRKGDRLVMKLKGSQEIEVDHLIAGIGIQPNTKLAESAGIEIANAEEGAGIRVNSNLETSQPNIFAAGDVASFFHAGLKQWVRVEHEDNANSMGYAAGLNMAGQPTPYNHQPYFYSDLFDLGYEAVGQLNPLLETVSDWQEPFRKGVIYYLEDQKVRGVLLWNVWGQVDAARRLISEDRKVQPSQLKNLLIQNG